MTKSEQFKAALMACVSDAVSNLVYYDRKNDEELRLVDLKFLIKSGIVTRANIVAHFAAELARQFPELK